MRKNKILSQKEVFEISFKLRKEGKVVGLTHGAFDMFNISHLDLLQKSKFLCDFLIVGIDTDESIFQYKENTKPIIDENNRLKIINKLDFFGAIFMKNSYFIPSEHTQELYYEIRPNFITIGNNFFKEDKIVHDAKTVSTNLLKLNVIRDLNI